ncbi:MAG: histidine--tRNA ligase, partial [Sciscionella sp.]
ESYGFEPLQTPAFENLSLLAGKDALGAEAEKLIFKILRRGEHEASGEADLALRYDLTVPLARVVAHYGHQLPSPYKRYAFGSVWRADRPGRGRFREFTQCDVDIVGSRSPLADAEILSALGESLDALAVTGWTAQVNSRRALAALLRVYRVPEELGTQVLTTLDKLDKLGPDEVVTELVQRGLPSDTASSLVGDLAAPNAVDRMRAALRGDEDGRAGLTEVDDLISLSSPRLGADRVVFSPQLVRGLDYYTGAIFEITAPGFTGSICSGGRYDGLVAALGGGDVPACGGSIGFERILAALPAQESDARGPDVALTVLDSDAMLPMSRLAAELRSAGITTELFLGETRKLAKQLKWASGMAARLAVICGPAERESGELTIRRLDTAEQLTIDRNAALAHIHDQLRAPPSPAT